MCGVSNRDTRRENEEPDSLKSKQNGMKERGRGSGELLVPTTKRKGQRVCDLEKTG